MGGGGGGGGGRKGLYQLGRIFGGWGGGGANKEEEGPKINFVLGI